MIHSQLFNHVRLVDLKEGVLTLSLLDSAQSDLIEKLTKLLKDKTGKPWEIVVSKEQAPPTLAEVVAEKKALLKADVSEGPLVKYVLESFPGSKIEKITER